MRLDESKTQTIVAWGDESILMSAAPPLYLLAASVFKDFPDSATKTLENLKPKGARKLHWRSMTDAQKAKSIKAIAAIEHHTTIVVGSPLVGVKQERARRKCLELLLMELESLGVSKLIMESRQELLDKRDVDCLMFARRTKSISRIDLAHVLGEEDSRLWMPDQILGAFGECARRPEKSPTWSDAWKKTIEHLSIKNLDL